MARGGVGVELRYLYSRSPTQPTLSLSHAGRAEFQIRGPACQSHQLMEPNRRAMQQHRLNGRGLKERQITASPPLLLLFILQISAAGKDNDAERQLPLLTCQRGRNA